MNPTTQPTTVALLAVMKLKGFGRRAALNVVGEPTRETEPLACRDFFVARTRRLYGERLSATDLKKQFGDAWTRSEEQLRQSQDADIRAVSIYEAGYPMRLRRIPDPPAVLFVKGNAQALEAAKSLAVVGTREPTGYGETVAQRSARAVVKAGFAVVSGLAHGCDVKAHEGCLDAGGTGVAVLAHGLDKVYPAPNLGLAMRLLEGGGCLVSEYPVSVKPSQLTFAERDRLQSGLADGVLVIETDIEGGTQNTIRYARRQKRPLACIQHPGKLLSEPKARGNQQLINEGAAMPIPDEASLLRFLGGLEPVSLHTAEAAAEGQPASDQMQMF